MIKVKKVLLNCTAEEDRTKQSFRDECDMNNIVARIQKSGFIPLEAQASLRRQVFGDASALPQTLEEVYAVVRRADNLFARLPAALRERFVNPAGLLNFVENDENKAEAVSLGLLVEDRPKANPVGNSGTQEPVAPAAPVQSESK